MDPNQHPQQSAKIHENKQKNQWIHKKHLKMFALIKNTPTSLKHHTGTSSSLGRGCMTTACFCITSKTFRSTMYLPRASSYWSILSPNLSFWMRVWYTTSHLEAISIKSVLSSHSTPFDVKWSFISSYKMKLQILRDQNPKFSIIFPLLICLNQQKLKL